MAGNLVKRGYPLTVYDIRPEAIQALEGLGAEGAGSPREVAERSDIVISSLPTPRSVEEAALGSAGIVEGLGEGKVYIDMSTIDPDTTRKVGRAVAAKGAKMLDVPVGKGPPAAAEGDLTLMVGGDPDAVESVGDVLDALGSQRFYCGGSGMGVTTKLVNNLVSCSIATLLGEAFTLGVAAGLDADVLRDVMMHTAADTAHARNSLKTRVFARNFEPNFKLMLSHKDLGLAAQLAASLGAPNMMGSTAYQIQTLAMGKDLGHEDQTATVKVAEEAAGVVVKGSDVDR